MLTRRLAKTKHLRETEGGRRSMEIHVRLIGEDKNQALMQQRNDAGLSMVDGF